MNSITIDTRETHRIDAAKEFFESKKYQVKIQQEKVGDYIFNDQVVMEFKTWSDFMSSITDGRLWNESINQIENYTMHFVVLHGTNRDYQEAFQHNGLTDEMVTGAIARLLTYTKIIRGTGTLNDTFELMRCTAEKCLDNKTLTRQFGTKSINPAFNFLCYCVDDIKGERAKTIVNYLHLKTLDDLMKLDAAQLTSVPGIGEVLAGKILEALGK